MTALFSLTLFLGALLLFLIQPMIARLVLPLLGGSPSVWNTCIALSRRAGDGARRARPLEWRA